MKFLVPNYSCLQNPWLRGYRPQIPVLCVLCPQLDLLNPPPKKIPGYATVLPQCQLLAGPARPVAGASCCCFTLQRPKKPSDFVTMLVSYSGSSFTHNWWRHPYSIQEGLGVVTAASFVRMTELRVPKLKCSLVRCCWSVCCLSTCPFCLLAGNTEKLDCCWRLRRTALTLAVLTRGEVKPLDSKN